MSIQRFMPTLAALIVFVMLGSGSISAQEPVDPVVTSAVAVIEHYESLVKDLKPGDTKTAQQMIDGLKPIGLKLQKVEDKTTPSFVDAGNRFNALRAKIVEIANQPAAGTADVQVLHKDVLAAFADMKKLVVADLGDPATRKTWVDRMADFKARLATLDPSDRNTKTVSANISKLSSFLDDALVKADAAKKSEGGTAKEADPNRPLTSEEVRARHERKKAEAARAREEAIARNKAQAEVDAADAAAIQQKIDAVREKYLAEGAVPGRLEDPLTADFVRGWAARVKATLDAIPADVKKLEALKGEKNVDKQKLSSAIYWIGSNLPRNLEEMKQYSAILLDGRVQIGLDAAKFIQETDAKNRDHVVNRILGEGRFDEQMGRLQTGLENLAVAEAFDEGIQRKDGPDRVAQRKALEGGVNRLQELAVLALDEVRMPPAASTDPKLLAAAKETFKVPSYGVGTVLATVISYGFQHREKKEGWVSPGSLNSATVSIYNYVWDEFGVTTAEKEGEDVWLYWNKFKYYYSGDTRTTLKRWILVDRFKTTRILEKNVK